jgi:4-aminobutyrate aminotransferase/(S)-3-amino-2-methylpropionate transaminase
MSQTNNSLLERRNKAVPRGPFNVTTKFVASANGATVVDVEGKEYIDFAAGIGVVGVAHNHPKINAAAKAQLDKYVHTCFHVLPYEPYIELAERLNALTPGDFEKKTAFFNSGAEAVENAIKVARAYTGRHKKGFGPFAPETYRAPFAYCYRCPYGAEGPESCSAECAENVKDMFTTVVDPDSVAAVILEPVQGEGGFVPAPKIFVDRLFEIAAEHGIVTIMDEVQTCFGRTGKLFASEAIGVVPDVMTMAKAMANGFPLSGVTGKSEIMEAPQVGGIGGTYGGNPISCAASLATLDVIEEENLLERAGEIGTIIRERFESFKERFEIVGDVRGIGAMLAIELVTDKKSKAPATAQTKELAAYALEQGLITITAGTSGNVFRLLPPLAIDDATLIRGLDIMEAGLEKVS